MVWEPRRWRRSHIARITAAQCIGGKEGRGEKKIPARAGNDGAGKEWESTSPFSRRQMDRGAGGRPGLPKFGLQLRDSAGLSPASPFAPLTLFRETSGIAIAGFARPSGVQSTRTEDRCKCAAERRRKYTGGNCLCQRAFRNWRRRIKTRRRFLRGVGYNLSQAPRPGLEPGTNRLTADCSAD